MTTALPIVDDDGLYVVDADPADFDLEIAIVWQNDDGTFNSRSTIATVPIPGVSGPSPGAPWRR
jgi:hypothetical protein